MPAFHELRIAEIRPEAEDAVALSLDLPETLREAYAFRPGQYLTLRAEIDGVDVRRSYSLCSLPGEDRLTVGIRHVPGGLFSGLAHQGLMPGDKLRVMTPEGRFVLGDEERILLIAAGSGVTPMLSIARAALARGAEVTLVYGNRTTGSIMFREALDALKDRYMDRLTLIHILSREGQDVPLLEGRIDAGKLSALARTGAIDPGRADGVFVCGPGEMIDAVSQALVGLGVPEGGIHSERFTPAEGVRGAPPSERASRAASDGVSVEVILDGARRRFALGAGDASIIDAAHRQGLELPFSCKGGMCCTCRCRVVEGAAEMAVNYSLQPWEVEAGFTLACQARPVTERLVLDFDAA
ncbi:MAG: 2Fe-2S iron-sulfur cluster binding domain-containing protein [Rhodobacteraceae bacterium]|nr:2Fe-2S iron-sulfur cluster binding domain-containing protein [Paracoccaceae bacterium]